MKKNIQRMPAWFLCLFVTLALGLSAEHTAAEMSTPNFRITQDVVGSFGTSDASANFKLGDTGGEVATGPADAINFKLNAGFWQAAQQNPLLQFSMLDDTVLLGELTPTQAKADSAIFSAGTNAKSGFVVQYFGSSLQNGSHTISPLSTPGASVPGTEQFGMNVMANTDPVIGADPQGGQGSAASGYDTPDQFRFLSGDTIALSTKQTSPTTYTLSVMSNIAPTTDAADYTATITMIATGKF